MSKIGGRQVEIGIGIETVAGTPVAVSDYFKWESFTFQGITEKMLLNSARGIRNKTSAAIIAKKYGKGTLEFVVNTEILPYVLGLVFGTRSSGTHAGETVVYDHTFSIQNANASMKTATIIVKQGGVQVERYANVVVDTVDLTIDKGLAKVKLGVIGMFPDTSTLTASYTNDVVYSRNETTAKFGATLTAAASATATPLIGASLSINNNVQFEDAFLSGSSSPVAGGFCAGVLDIKGSYQLHFADTTELAKYQANTLNALILALTGPSISGSTVPTAESATFKIGRMVLTKEPLEYKIDGLVTLKQEFAVSYDATDKEVGAVVTNGYVGTNYQ